MSESSMCAQRERRKVEREELLRRTDALLRLQFGTTLETLSEAAAVHFEDGVLDRCKTSRSTGDADALYQEIERLYLDDGETRLA